MESIENIIKKDFKVIGRHRYNHLKRQLEKLNQNDVDALVRFRKLEKLSVSEAEKEVLKFEEKNKPKTKELSEKEIEYNNKIRDIQEKKETSIKRKERNFSELKVLAQKEFLKEYRVQNGVNYSTDKESVENLKPLIYYFIGDLENFKKCKNVSKISEPKLEKGLLLVGDFGTGKTSALKVFSKILRGTPDYFSVIGSKELVRKFESLKKKTEDQELFYSDLSRGKWMFDDILKENAASSFGKVNLLEQLLEERERKKLKTHANINYKTISGETIKDVEVAVEQIGENYGGYIYDRIYSMWNIVEFKGKSYRK